jgi:hypothetical protein
MRTIKLFFLLAPVFFTCAGLHAQVTIGSLENPKAGAILDLNSSVKGGLVLSNVEINNWSKIPAGFPGIISEQESNAALSGMMVYNTGATLVPAGIYVWDGYDWIKGGMLAISSVSPSSGPVGGGQRITISGGYFPHATIDEYVPDGLVAFYDGINNTGGGDVYHSVTTDTWVDLVTGWDKLKLTNAPAADAGWTTSGFKVSPNSYFLSTEEVPDIWPDENEPRTVEIIYRVRPESDLPANFEGVMLNYTDFTGDISFAGRGFYVRYRGEVGNSFQPLAVDYDNIFIYDAKNHIPSLYQKNTLHTITTTYANSLADETNTNFIIDGVPAPEAIVTRNNTSLNTLRGHLKLGRSATGAGGVLISGFTFYSVRVYNRVLISAEIQQNARLDQLRYTQTPTIEIGSDEDGWVKCTDVAILDSSTITCITGAHTELAGATIQLTLEGSEIHRYIVNAYSYVNP